MAFIVALVSAFVTRPAQSCIGEPQYYFNGSAYIAAGVLGRDYICSTGSGICTYIGGNGSYQACQSGIYMPLHVQPATK